MSQTSPSSIHVDGAPTPEELAVVIALFSATGADEQPAPGPKPRGGWNDPRRSMRATLHPGPGGWRASAR